MRNVQQRKIIRDLWQNRARTILVVLSIAVGVFAFGVIAGARNTLLREVNQQYLAVNPASATLYLSPFNESLVESIRRMPEVAAVEGRQTITVRQQLQPGEWADLQLFVIDDFETIPLSIIRPETGAWPPPEQTLLIERKSIDRVGAGIGESILVEIPGGKQRQLQISGLAYDLTRPPTAISGVSFGYITFDTLAWLGLSPVYTELLFSVAEQPFDQTHIEQVAVLVEAKAERAGYTVYRTDIPEPGKHPAEEILPTILLILGMLGVLSLLLSGFLVINTVSAILAQQRRQIGVMKAIGARTGDIARLYAKMVFAFGFLAIVLAIPLGIIGARGLSQFVSGQLNIDILTYSIQPRVLVMEIVVGLLVPIIASLYPILSTARLTVREALAAYGLSTGQFGTSLIDRLLIGIRHIIALSRPLMLSLRNTFRRKGRLTLTLITLVLGGAIFISVLTVRASLFNTLDQALIQNDFDLMIQFNRPYRIAAITRQVAAVPGVKAVEGWGRATANRIRDDGSEGDNLIINAPPADTAMLQLEVVSGRWLGPLDENAIVVNNRFLLDEPDLTLNSLVTLKIGEIEHQWRIVGVTEELRPPLSPATVYVNHHYFAQTVGDIGSSSTLRVVTDQRGDAASQATVAKRLEAYFASQGIQVSTIRTTTEDRVRIAERFNILTGLLMVMSLLMALVGGLGLMGTMSINVLERGREIGVIRAIGASDGTVMQLVIVEGVLIGCLSWSMGAVFSLPLSRVMGTQIGQALFQMPLAYTFSISGLAIWLAAVVSIAGLASFLPAWNASRLTVREVLAYE